MDSVSVSISESSMTSNTSARSLNLTKENASSPVDLECNIQTERITKLLDQAVLRTKLVLCLPILIHEQKQLVKHLHPQHLQEVKFIFNQYDNPLFSTSLVNMAAIEELKNGDLELKNRLNPELAHLLYIFDNNKSLQQTVDLLIENMKTAAIQLANNKQARMRSTNKRSIVEAEGSKYVIDIPVGFEYLLELERFRDLMVERMRTTAAEDLKARHQTRKLERSNQGLMEKILEYRETIIKENMEFERTTKDKKELIENLEEELKLMEQASELKRNNKILDSERHMVLLTRSHALRSEMLKDVESETREVYDRELRKHVLEESSHRQRRNKVETQLLSWIRKYDNDMTEKQTEIDEVTALYDQEVELCDKLEKQLEEQDKEFIPLMAEREEEYHAEMTEKMNQFRAEHAARVLQMAWRQTLANRAEKHKLRKLLKAQQAAAERALKAAEAEAKKAAAEAKKAAAEAKKAAAEAKKAAAETKRADNAAVKEAKSES